MDESRLRRTDADMEWCYGIVPEVSRTFALTIDRLEEPMSARICLGYLLCRIADTIEDSNELSPATQADLLRTYRDALDPETDTTIETFRREVSPHVPDERDADWKVVADAPRVLATFDTLPEEARSAIRPPILEMVDGMAMFVDRYAVHGGLRIGTVRELEEYCWYVAGLVGRLVTNLLTQEASDDQATVLRRTAPSFGLLLQMVNVAKDVASDFEEERNVYLPATWLSDEGVHPSEVARQTNADGVGRVVSRLVDWADRYVDDARAYLEAMPLSGGNTLSAWAIPFLLAVATRRELRRRPEDVVRNGEVKVDREEVFALLQLFEAGDVERDGLDEVQERIATDPLV